MELGKRIKTLRNSRGLTQLELAEALNMKQSGLSMIETGRNGLGIDHAVKIADILGVTLDELVRGDTEPDAADGEPVAA